MEKAGQQHPNFSGKGIQILSLAFFLLYLIAFFSPEKWWGIHFAAFLQPPWNFLFLLAGAAAMAAPFLLKKEISFFRDQPAAQAGGKNIATALAVAVLSGMIFYHAAPPDDFFGDAPKYLRALTETGPDSQIDHLSLLLDPNIFHVKNGERTVLNGIYVLAQASGTDPVRTFYLTNAILGAAFIFIFILFIRKMIQHKGLRLISILMVISTPVGLNFAGHAEIYAPSLLFISAFLMSLILAIRTSAKKWLLISTVILFICIKFHISAFLLFPSLLLTVLVFIIRKYDSIQVKLTWEKTLKWLIIPLLSLGLVVYFFVLGDDRDPRFLNENVPAVERLFLPVFSPDAPLDRYKLAGFNHLLDFFNLLLLLSPSAIFVVTGVFLFRRKRINPDAPAFIVTAVALILYLAFFFMLNPLLGMPVDWDLFSLPAPALLVMGVVLLSQMKDAEFIKQMSGGMLGLVMLSLPVFMVNAGRDSFSLRMESVGRHVFKTYWIRSAGDICAGLELVKDRPEAYRERFTKVVNDLEPFALKGKDIEYGELVRRLAAYHRKELRDIPSALSFHQKAYLYDPLNDDNLIGLIESHFLLGQFAEAYQYSTELVRVSGPENAQAYRIAIQCALEAGMYEEAKAQSAAYLSLWPEDLFIRQVSDSLQSGVQIEALKMLFKRG